MHISRIVIHVTDCKVIHVTDVKSIRSQGNLIVSDIMYNMYTHDEKKPQE